MDQPATLSRMPLFFVANTGDLPPEVQYEARLGDVTVLLTLDGIVLQRVRRPTTHARGLSDEPERGPIGDARVANVAVEFAGHSPGMTLEALDPVAAPVHAFRGRAARTWGVSIPAYRTVRFHEVYPGVDIELYARSGHIEYDLRLQPGADASAIVMRVEGASGLSLDRDGSLVLQTDLGPLRQAIPETVEIGDDGSQRRIACSHLLLDQHRFGFAVPEHDGGRGMIIDPGIEYSTYLGGSLDDQGFAVAVDGTGIYVTGSTNSNGFPITPGAWDTTYAGATDAYVAKLDLTGTQLLFATYIGGSGSEAGNDLAVDSAGAVYVTGWTSSADFPVTPGAYGTTFIGGGNLLADAFALKLAPTGDQLEYSTYIAGDNDDIAVGIALGPLGEAYVVGGTSSDDFPTTPGVAGSSFGGGSDAFLTKIDPAGSALIYSTYLGGVDDDDAWDVVADASGDVWVAGREFSINFPVTPGSYDTSYNGSFDIFVTRYDPTAAGIVWSTIVGGVRRDEGNALAVDPNGVVYVAGVTRSYDFPVSHGAFDEVWNGVYDQYVLKLSADGAHLLAATYLGGSQIDYARGLAIDAAGNAYVVGLSWSSDFPTTPGSLDSTFNGFIDATLTKFDPDLTRMLYSTFMGGPADDMGLHVTIDGAGAVYVTGTTRGSFPVTGGSFDSSWNGGLDAYVTKLDAVSSCPASNGNFGMGWPGTNGVPSLTASADPVLCSTIAIQIGNSYGSDTLARLVLGSKAIAHRTSWDGYLLVAPLRGAMFKLPAAGLQLPFPIGCDADLCGTDVYLQALESDPGASRGVSFSLGLKLALGN